MTGLRYIRWISVGATVAAVSLASAHGLPVLCRALFNANEFVFVD